MIQSSVNTIHRYQRVSGCHHTTISMFILLLSATYDVYYPPLVHLPDTVMYDYPMLPYCPTLSTHLDVL